MWLRFFFKESPFIFFGVLRRMDIEKSARLPLLAPVHQFGPTFWVFRVLYKNTLKSFCYFWALDISFSSARFVFPATRSRLKKKLSFKQAQIQSLRNFSRTKIPKYMRRKTIRLFRLVKRFLLTYNLKSQGIPWWNETSRERHKSAPYLRLRNSKRTSNSQVLLTWPIFFLSIQYLKNP